MDTPITKSGHDARPALAWMLRPRRLAGCGGNLPTRRHKC
jgi:hypothetical protein